ncbi:hypothetical protein ES705_34623 [subsurface metagenome]
MNSEKQEGYLKIGNKTIDNLIDNKAVDYKMRVYLLTVRMVNGWDKESLQIPVSTYSNRLGIDERYTKRLLKELKKENLIHRNGSLTSIPGDYIQWWGGGKNLPPPGVVKNLQKGGKKLPLKQWSNITTLNTPTLQVKTPGGFSIKMKKKDKEKLEGKEWLREDMLDQHLFSKSFIDDILPRYPFMTLYDCWLKLLESNGVNSPEGWYISKLRNYQEEE